MKQSNRIALASIASQIASFSVITLSGVALLAALCLVPASASAQTPRMGGGSARPGPGAGQQPSGPPRPLFRPAPPTVVNTAPSVVYQPRFFYSVPPNYYRPFYGSVPYYQRPVPYAYAPTYFPGPYVAPSYSQWTPGYYDKDGVWVAGYHAAQVTQSGYYQPYWVSGYGTP